MAAPYRLACELRNQVLRRLLNFDLYQKDLAAEGSQLNFGPHQSAVKVRRA